MFDLHSTGVISFDVPRIQPSDRSGIKNEHKMTISKNTNNPGIYSDHLLVTKSDIIKSGTYIGEPFNTYVNLIPREVEKLGDR